MTTAATTPVLKSNIMISIETPNPNRRNSSLRPRPRRLATNYSNFENYLRSLHNYSGRLRLQVAAAASSFPPVPFGRGAEGRGFAAAAAHLPNPDRRNCPHLVTNYSNSENYFRIRHNYSVGRNRRLLQLPPACSSSPEPSPSLADIVFVIGVVTVYLGSLGWSLGWKSAMRTQPCSSFISSSTSHPSNCCRCYRHCACVEHHPEDDDEDDDEEIIDEF